MKMSRVKDCPFCEGNDIHFRAHDISDNCVVHCVDCGKGMDSEVPWDGMTIVEHDKACFEHLLLLWNNLCKAVDRDRNL